MHNVVNNKASGYLMDLFEKSYSVYALRDNESRLLLSKSDRILSLQKELSFSFVGAKVGNAIPPYHITTPTLCSAV